MSKFINIVATECEPKVEKKFNEWYNKTHIPMLMKYKGIKAVKRIKAVQPGKEAPVYLALYEYDSLQEIEAMQKSPEMAAVQDEMKVTWKDGGFKVVWRGAYEVLGDWKQSK